MPEYLQKPQINISCPSAGRMWLVCLCAFLCIGQSSINDGGRTLIAAFTALITALLLEFLLTWKKDGIKKIKNGSAAATAMILTILLPNQIHPVYVFFGTAFAIVVIKYSFGGLGSNWLNPALGGWLFIRFSWPHAFSSAPVSVLQMPFASNVSALDNSVTGFINNTVFSITNVKLPSGYIDLLFRNDPGIITDRGLFALLIGTIIITAIGINRGWIPLVFLGVYGFLIRFAGDTEGALWNGDLLYGIFSGGTIAAAFILAAEPASGAKLRLGVLFTVVLGAVLSWFFRYKCMEYAGCFIALSLVNCLAPLVRYAEEIFFLNKNKDSDFQENLL